METDLSPCIIGLVIEFAQLIFLVGRWFKANNVNIEHFSLFLNP